MARTRQAQQSRAKRARTEESNDDSQVLKVPSRKDEFNTRTWWMVDLDSLDEMADRQGASHLVARCMREYGWDSSKAKKILKGYRQFLQLKVEYEDWDATKLSPSPLVDQMWHCHILDVFNYFHDCRLLCNGHLLGHNPDGAVDAKARSARIAATKQALMDTFGEAHIDFAITWKFPSDVSETQQKVEDERRQQLERRDPNDLITIRLRHGRLIPGW